MNMAKIKSYAHGIRVEQVHIGTRIAGSEDNDILIGQDGDDLLFGFGGNDVLNGGAGDDILHGGMGDDVLDGGEGSDRIDAGKGDDLVVHKGLNGDGVFDRYNGGKDNDIFRIELNANEFLDAQDELISLQKHIDSGAHTPFVSELLGIRVQHFEAFQLTVNGQAHDPTQPFLKPLFTEGADRVNFLDVQAGDYLEGTQYDALGGDDYVRLPWAQSVAEAAGYDPTHAFSGGSGNDVIIGGGSMSRGNPGLADTIYGDAGNDTIWGGQGDDHIFGGEGADTLYGGVDAGLWHSGGYGSNYIDGGAGDDYIRGALGHDELHGGDGNDSIFGGNGMPWETEFSDKLYGEDGNDSLTGGRGGDELYGGAGNDYLNGNSGNDRLYGGSGNDIIQGGSGNDRIDGGSGVNSLRGGPGGDTFYLGQGSDTVDGGTGSDTVDYGGYTTVNPDLVASFEKIGIYGVDTDGVMMNLMGGDTMGNRYSNVENVNGSELGDELYGREDGASIINGRGGNDVLDGRAGDDILNGGDGNDVILGDYYWHHDIAARGSGDDVITGGRGDDVLIGGDGDDTFIYNSGDGSDTVIGGRVATTAVPGVGGTTAAAYDNAEDVDTLVLKLTLADYQAAEADIAAFNSAIQGGDTDSWYSFESLGIDVIGVEELDVYVDGIFLM